VRACLTFASIASPTAGKPLGVRSLRLATPPSMVEYEPYSAGEDLEGGALYQLASTLRELTARYQARC